MGINQDRGKRGEDLAAEYLESQGYEIVARRFSCRMGEIDIIARTENTMVFVEVKSRSGGVYGRPAEAVTASKRRKIMLAAQLYLQQHALDDVNLRFDVLEVYLGYSRVCHIEQAF